MNTTPRFIAALALAGAFVSTSLSAAESGPYIRLDNGVSSISGADLKLRGSDSNVTEALDLGTDSAKLKFKSGYVFGGAVGYRFNESFAAEIELDHATNKLDTVGNSTAQDAFDQSVTFRQTSLLAGAVYSVKLVDPVTLNLGVAVGAQFCSNNLNSASQTETGTVSGVAYTGTVSGNRKSDTSFVAQLKTGVSFALAKGLTFDAGYKLRFLSSSDVYDINYSATGGGNTYAGTYKMSVESRLNHVFTAGFTYAF